MIFYNNLRT